MTVFEAYQNEVDKLTSQLRTKKEQTGMIDQNLVEMIDVIKKKMLEMHISEASQEISPEKAS